MPEAPAPPSAPAGTRPRCPAARPPPLTLPTRQGALHELLPNSEGTTHVIPTELLERLLPALRLSEPFPTLDKPHRTGHG
jgi:hypothetical protein